jgi:hypothetical protein
MVEGYIDVGRSLPLLLVKDIKIWVGQQCLSWSNPFVLG